MADGRTSIITKITVLPDFRIAVQFTCSLEPLPASYTIVARLNGVNTTGTTTSNIGFVGPLLHRATYAVTVVDGDNDSNAVNVTIDPEVSYESVIRQAVSNILHEATLAIDGRTINLLHDDLQRPKTLKRREPVGTAYPFVEIGSCYQSQRNLQTRVRAHCEYSVPIRIYDVAGDDDAVIDRLTYVATLIQTTIDVVPNLRLAGLLVSDWSWWWTASEPEASEGKSRAWTYQLVLTVPVSVMIGRNLFAANV